MAVLLPFTNIMEIEYHTGFPIVYQKIKIFKTCSLQDLLWDLYRLPYRSVAPSLSAQLIVIVFFTHYVLHYTLILGYESGKLRKSHDKSFHQ